MLMCIEYKFKERKRKRADAQRNCEDGGKTFFFLIRMMMRHNGMCQASEKRKERENHYY